MIIFENSGEIDPRLIQLIGVNVKAGDSPIGYFGTGLKYAIASMLRWGEFIKIQSGLVEFGFVSEAVEIRGREFSQISMVGERDRLPLSFTTELGKNWLPWMVYRELWSNCQDEPGPRIYEAPEAPRPQEGLTRIIVSGTEIESAHAHRREFLLLDRPGAVAAIPGLVEIYPGPGRNIYYRGIAVQALARPSIYEYNILRSLTLTEDRTTASWQTGPIICEALMMAEDEEMTTRVLTSGDAWFEPSLDYSWVFRTPSTIWSTVALRETLAAPLDVPQSIRKMFLPEEFKERICPTCGQVRPR